MFRSTSRSCKRPTKTPYPHNSLYSVFCIVCSDQRAGAARRQDAVPPQQLVFCIPYSVLYVQINEQELQEAKALYPHNSPVTKEALLYRKTFEAKFPNKAAWIPYFWMPRWSATKDPSARTLKHYKQ